MYAMPLWLLLLLPSQEQPTFTSNVHLVHVDAEVRQEERLVEGLTKDDFRITDNGQPRTILYFGHQEEPLDIILLFDTSYSMRPVVERAAQAMREALAQLRPGDRVAVMAFDSDPELIGDFTGDFESVESTIRERVLKRPFRGTTQIQEAVAFAARHFISQVRPDGPQRRRAVLIVTDNLGMGRDSRALTDLWEADAVLSGVIVRSKQMVARYSIFYPPALLGVGGMSGLAEKTGGDTIGLDDAGEGLRRMIERLRLRYSLYYAMPETKATEERKIKVELTGDAARRYRGAKVRARTGYQAK